MRKVLCLLIVLGIFFFVQTKVALAASPKLYFDTTELTAKQGDEFDLLMRIDTAGQSVSGADAVLEYNPEYLEVSTIENGNFFALFGKHYEINNQKIYLTGFFTEKNQVKSGNGPFAQLTFKAVKNGATSIKFVCAEKSLSDTNIIGATGNDLISCADLQAVTITVSTTAYKIARASGFGKILGTESGALVTTTPTVTPTSTSTSSGMMETGVFDNAAFMIILGIIFILLGGYLLVYSRKNYLYTSLHYRLEPYDWPQNRT